MSQYTSAYTPGTSAGGSGDRPTTQVARDETAEVGRTAAGAAGQVAGTAAEQARNVAQEAKAQARDLVGEARGQVQQQARNGQQKATDGIRALVRELREMAEGGQQSGPASEVARQAADRADRLADWLGEREPGDLIEEVRSFARRRPGAFLAGAALAGVVVGRLTRGVVDASGGPAGRDRADNTPGYLGGRPGPLPYDRAVAAPLPPVDTPVDTAVPRPYAPPVDPSDTARSRGPLGAPPAGPVSGYAGPGYGTNTVSDLEAGPTGTHRLRPGASTVDEYTDELEREAGHRRGGVSDEPYRPEHRGPR